MRKDELNPVKLSIILFLIAGFSGFILSMVYSITQPRILENERKKEEESLKIIMPEIKSFTREKDSFLVYSDEEKKKLIGYIFKIEAKGYGGRVKCNIGIDLNGKIAGIVVASHSETPGLGSRIEEKKKGEVEPYYLIQFKNLALEQLDFENVKAITGATISSTAVLKCAQQAFEKFKKVKSDSKL